MNNRVFTIDRNCMLIFAEELSSRKERFLRIGNSPELASFGDKMTFLDLVTPMAAGSIKTELDIFKKERDQKVIGLKRYVNDYIRLLVTNHKEVSALSVIFADEQTDTKKTEEEFINGISGQGRESRHSFAAFYGDGNLRIFNREGIFFDLQKHISSGYSITDELHEVYGHYAKRYDYEGKDGFVVSGNSLFIFSGNRYICVTESGNWTFDAALVGIDPFAVEALCLVGDVVPDFGWNEVCYEQWRSGRRLRVAGREMTWCRNELVYYTNPAKHTFEYTANQMTLLLQNNRLRIKVGGIKLALKTEAGLLKKGSIWDFSFIDGGHAHKGKLAIDTYVHGAYTVFERAPLVFYGGQHIDNSVIDTAAVFGTKLPAHIQRILFSDDRYAENYIIPFENRSSLSLSVIGESIRRVVSDGSGRRRDTFDAYTALLSNVSGEYFCDNGLALYQYISLGRGRVVIKNILRVVAEPHDRRNKDLFQYSINEKDEPIFKNVLDDSYVRDSNEYKEERERADRALELFAYYRAERERLREFMGELELHEQEMERQGLPFDAPYSTLHEEHRADQAASMNTADALSGDVFNASELFADELNRGTGRLFFKVAARIIALILIAALLAGGWYFLRKPVGSAVAAIYKKAAGFRIPALQKEKNGEEKAGIHSQKQNAEKQEIEGVHTASPAENGGGDAVTQKKRMKELSVIREKADSIDGIKKRRSNYYHFFMTGKDILDITNKIALSNGYRRILFPFELKYTGGTSPDWIYPGNVLVMPDGSRVIVKSGDVLWRICESYLVGQMNRDEIKIKETINRSAKGLIGIDEAQQIFRTVIEGSDSEMIRSFCSLMLMQDQYTDWQYMDKTIAESYDH